MEDILTGIQEKFGKDAAFYLSSPERLVHDLGFVSTGSFSVDYVIGRPGIPLGRVTEIFGPYSSCKSSIVASIIGQCQARGGSAFLFDGEHSFTPDWVKLFNVDPERLILLQPLSIKDMFEQAAYICQAIRDSHSDKPFIVAIDSLSSFPTPEELEILDPKYKEEGKAHFQMGLHARYVAKGLRILSNLIWDARVALLVVSQLKDNPMNPYSGFKLGGEACNFHAALQLKTVKLQKSETKIKVRIKAEKNKLSPPFREAVFEFVFGQGIDDSLTFAEVAEELKLVTKKGGGWYEMNGQNFRAEDLISQVGRAVYKHVFPELFPLEVVAVTTPPVETTTNQPPSTLPVETSSTISPPAETPVVAPTSPPETA